MNNIKELTEDLAKMFEEGKIVEAFEKYYAEDVVMQENEDTPRIGKAASEAAEQAFEDGIVENNSKTTGIAIGDNYSTIETSMDIVHKAYGHIIRHQVAVQKWKDGKIVYEKFYYNTK